MPSDLWDIILGHLRRFTDVHINMEDGDHDVTFLTRSGFRRGDSFLVQVDELRVLDFGPALVLLESEYLCRRRYWDILTLPFVNFITVL